MRVRKFAKRIRKKREGNTVTTAVEHIRDIIISGRAAPSQRLIAADLIREIGISRGTMREAFRRLAAEGFLEIVPNRGAVVRRLSREQVCDLFQIRENLEGLAAQLAAKRISKQRNRILFETAWKEIQSDGGICDANIFMRNNRLFHNCIVELCGNTRLSELIELLNLSVMMFQVGEWIQPANMKNSHQDHIRIANAILKGNPITADREMRRHIRRLARWILKLPDPAFRLQGRSVSVLGLQIQK